MSKNKLICFSLLRFIILTANMGKKRQNILAHSNEPLSLPGTSWEASSEFALCYSVCLYGQSTKNL